MARKVIFNLEELKKFKTNEDVLNALENRFQETQDIQVKKILDKYYYEKELIKLQAELVNLQQFIADNKKKVAIIFEGRDAAGKGGTIKRFKEHLNPRSMRTVALNKPTDIERGQWYFRRYIKELPNIGEICFFDRSWYNRAVVEPIMGFCSQEQYERFLLQVPEFEHMLYEDGVKIIKFWFSVSKEEQLRRFEARQKNPLKNWKFSDVDAKGQEMWDQYTYYKEQMFSKTHTSFSPWVIVKSDNKKLARLESIRYVLSQFDYPHADRVNTNILPDPNIVSRYHRQTMQIDL